MRPDDVATLRSLIRSDEGLRLRPYPDTEGKLTIGYGRNLTDDGITPLEASDMLEHDLTNVIWNVQQAFPIVMTLDGVRQIVLTDMAYNMGVPKLSGFVKMWTAINAGDYKTAALEMLDSQWANQVHARATRLAAAMESGEFQ